MWVQPETTAPSPAIQIATDGALNCAHPLLRIFILHASHNLTNHAENGDGLVAWGYIEELARRGHRIYAVTDKLDVKGEIPPNLTLIEFPNRSKNKAIHYVRYMAKVRSLFERIVASDGIDVVHQMNPVVRGLSLALVGRSVPLVLGTYVGDWRRREGARGVRFRWPALRETLFSGTKLVLDALQQYQADEIVLATPHAISRVPFAFLQAERIRFLHHGVDTRLFRPDPQDGDLAPLPRSIVFLGAVRANKGAGTLIDAFRLVSRAIPQAELVFIGRGRVEEWKQRLAEYGLLERARFLGSLPRREVARWLRACGVLCAPSFGEPYGQNILEAMASGKPVVGTDVGGHRYLLDAAGSAQICPTDANELAAALIAILGDSALADRMGEHNRLLAVARNSWPHVASELEKIYRDAIDRHAVRTAVATHGASPSRSAIFKRLC